MATQTGTKSVLQDWVHYLGLRHQGTLLTGIRGCDTSAKDSPDKLFVRCYRATVLNAHCGDAAMARTFIEKVGEHELEARFQDFRRSADHLPHHYLMHMVHCVEIVGYKHPDGWTRQQWHGFYLRLVKSLHLNPETESELDARLNADEETFAQRDAGWCCDGPVVPSSATITPAIPGGAN